MPENTDNCDLPEGWIAIDQQLTGHSKLYAVFQHLQSGTEVHIVPYKSYGLPGFTNCHRITVEKPNEQLKVIAEGLEIERSDEAKERAIEVMKEYN